MSSSDLPERVQELLLEAIDSVAELEALLLLRSTPDQRWTVEATSARLYIGPALAAQALTGLARRGFLNEDAEGFAFQPSSPALAGDVTALARAYATSLIQVTNLIHSKPSSSIQDFARAFRIRKDGG
jgi:hypothetical protein